MSASIHVIAQQTEKSFLDGIKTYETRFQKVIGWALSFFGYTLRVYTASS